MASESHSEAHHHIVPIRTYVATILLLVVLMAITVGVSYVPLPDVGPISGTIMNQLVALVIAVMKASLVIAIFMGVRWSTRLTQLWAMLGFVWLSFFMVFAADYAMRHFEDVQGWDAKSDSALPRVLEEPGTPAPDPNYLNVRPRQ